jgi:hypothetical protein
LVNPLDPLSLDLAFKITEENMARILKTEMIKYVAGGKTIKKMTPKPPKTVFLPSQDVIRKIIHVIDSFKNASNRELLFKMGFLTN